MQHNSSLEPALPSAWGEVLEKVQNALEKAVAQAAAREEALVIGAQPPETEVEHEAVRGRHLHKLEERLRCLQVVLRQAENEASEYDQMLGSEEEMLNRWHAAAAALKPRLADGAGSGI